jgi:hypothetical protein
MLAAAACFRLAHGLCDGGEVELARVVLEADGHAFDDEVHGGVVEGSGRRFAQLDLEPGGGQCDPQIRGELRVSAVAVVDEEARASNVLGRQRRAAARASGARNLCG